MFKKGDKVVVLIDTQGRPLTSQQAAQPFSNAPQVLVPMGTRGVVVSDAQKWDSCVDIDFDVAGHTSNCRVVNYAVMLDRPLKNPGQFNVDDICYCKRPTALFPVGLDHKLSTVSRVFNAVLGSSVRILETPATLAQLPVKPEFCIGLDEYVVEYRQYKNARCNRCVVHGQQLRPWVKASPNPFDELQETINKYMASLTVALEKQIQDTAIKAHPGRISIVCDTLDAAKYMLQHNLIAALKNK